QLWSGNDLRDITQHFARLKEKETPKVPTMQKSKTITPAIKATAATRDMEQYIEILGGAS
ncbi:IS21 family transposase, partial [Schinkia azotoformans]|nr:IS21 family transposase [Schinkia azotoformans]